jgi:dihydroorotate dehydrogenase (fumarate)
MTKLKTSYMGIELKNPIIIGASNLVSNIKNLSKMEESGAGAVVYRSLFEEQIQLEAAQMDDELEEYAERHAEMTSLFPSMEHAGPKEHLLNVRKAREALSIPLIASLNAIYKESWVEYARLLEETGVNGLELNFYYVPRDPKVDGSDVINSQIEVLKQVKKAVSIPVSVKLSPFYANPLHVITRMDEAGADAFVLFNRIFQPEIDIDREEHIVDFPLSSAYENKLPLRFTGLLYGNIGASIASARGIQDGKDVIKMILAGADAIQAVGIFYRNNISHIASMLKEIEKWMDRKGYKSLQEFRGKLSDRELKDPFIYKRAQYVDLLMKSDELFRQKIV